MLVTAYPNPSKYRLPIVGVTTTIILELSSQIWFDPNLALLSKISVWLESSIHYLLATPIFWLMGIIASKVDEENQTNT
ncbi:MAG: hypothetical protein GY829_01635 [Gammaproteobacteria bacterium]|nr:hypothetical protein [Gammaproteobacteria bacterium]